MNYTGRSQGQGLEQSREPFPVHGSSAVAPVEPLQPHPLYFSPQLLQHPGVIRDGIVGIVTTQLGVERIPLLPQTEVPIFTTPLPDGVECSPEPLARGLRLHPGNPDVSSPSRA